MKDYCIWYRGVVIDMIKSKDLKTAKQDAESKYRGGKGGMIQVCSVNATKDVHDRCREESLKVAA